MLCYPEFPSKELVMRLSQFARLVRTLWCFSEVNKLEPKLYTSVSLLCQEMFKKDRKIQNRTKTTQSLYVYIHPTIKFVLVCVNRFPYIHHEVYLWKHLDQSHLSNVFHAPWGWRVSLDQCHPHGHQRFGGYWKASAAWCFFRVWDAVWFTCCFGSKSEFIAY